MENVTQLNWSEDKYKNGEDIPETLLDDTYYIDRIVPSCNPENTCEVIQNFLEDNNVLDYPGQNNELIDSILDYKDYNEYKLKTSFKYKVLRFLKITK
jgi:hypothetical protein